MDKWMAISDIGHIISCQYSVVFVSLSMAQSITFFLLVVVPPMYTSRQKIIVVGFLNNHWVQVKLKHDFLLPPVIGRQRENWTEEARACEAEFAGRIRHWENKVRKLS